MITLDNVAMVDAVLGIVALSLWPPEIHSSSDSHDNPTYSNEHSH